jgi:hypothetical protein
VVADGSPANVGSVALPHERDARAYIKAPSAGLINWIPPIHALLSAAQAGFGEAQIRATVTAKSHRGQVRKHYIWYGLPYDRARLNTQCSIWIQMGWLGLRGGENRESQLSVSQAAREHNAGV